MTRVLRAGSVCLLILVSGCCSLRAPAPVHTAARPPRPLDPAEGLVFVVDGAGDFQCTTTNLGQALNDAHSRLTIRTFKWSHGRWRILADHLDRGHIRESAQELAAKVHATRDELGEQVPIYMVAQSGGCPLAVLAAEALPPGTLDRMVLLAPPLSADYDLRPALRSVRATIDVFYSPHDRIILGLCTRLLGTSDGRWTAASGRVGFHLPPQSGVADPENLYAKLRQFPWNEDMKWSGYDGGHLSVNKANFLHAYVLPLLHQPATPRAEPVTTVTQK